MWPMFVLSTVTGPRRCRLFLVDFFVRMWRLNAWPRLTVPPGRTRKRFFALLLVFILGMTAPFSLPRQACAERSRALVGLEGLLCSTVATSPGAVTPTVLSASWAPAP